MNIPGFFYDPISKRYFREPQEWDHVKLKPSAENVGEKPPDVQLKRRPKPTGMLGLLQNRELSMGKKNVNSFESHFLKLKTKSDFGTGEDLSAYTNEKIHDIVMIKPGVKSLFGLWKIKDPWENVVNEVFDASHPYPQFGKVKAAGITDFCFLSDSGSAHNSYNNDLHTDLLLTVLNDYSTQTGRVLIFRSHDEDILGIQDYPFRFYCKESTIFCCCSNSWIRRFALGVEHFVEIDHMSGSICKRAAIGNVHALQFNDRGTLLYCGIHSGVLSMMDMRQNTSCADKRLFKDGINEINLLSNQLQLICGSFEGDLAMFDLRMQRIALRYFEHKHSTKKCPMSFNESLNLLCATGTDNLTRLWSLSGGLPVRVIRPPEEFQPHRAWISNDPWKANIYLFQNELKYTCSI